MRIVTRDAEGRENGYLVTLWNANERSDLRPDQVYMTAVAPRSQKGPHLHKVRRGLFCCVKGNVRIVTRHEDGCGFTDHLPSCRCTMCTAEDGRQSPVLAGMPFPFYGVRYTGEDNGYPLVEVRPGNPACLYNDGDTEALVINMPSPAWSKDQQDEWEVGDWKP